jgi:hypothetical protein
MAGQTFLSCVSGFYMMLNLCITKDVDELLRVSPKRIPLANPFKPHHRDAQR